MHTQRSRREENTKSAVVCASVIIERGYVAVGEYWAWMKQRKIHSQAFVTVSVKPIEKRYTVDEVWCAMCCVFYIRFRKLKSPRNITSLMFALCRSIWCELKLGWSSSAFNQDFRSCGMVSPSQKRKFGAFLSLRWMNMTEIAPTNKTPLQLAGDNKDI